MELISTQMKNTMRENGMQIKEVDGAVCIMLMDLLMKANGMMITEVVKEC